MSEAVTGRDRVEHVAEERFSIEAKGLQLTYPDGTTAVDGVDLAIPRGEFFGFLGPNGAGKTTTIKMLATLLNPTDGRARIDGRDVTDDRRAVRASIGYMAQEVSVDEELTARENLEFACEAYGLSWRDRDDRIEDLLDLVDLAAVSDAPAASFSGGMKKRLDAATALVHDPALVFLDEPTTGLDPKARNRLWEYFRRINDQGTTIFLTTQYLEEADQLCDRLAVIRDGRIVADGSPGALKRHVGGEILEIQVAGNAAVPGRAIKAVRGMDRFDGSASITTEDGTIRITAPDASEAGTAVVLALHNAGIEVAGFDVEEPTLDEVFLAIADDDVPDLVGSTEPGEVVVP